MLTLRSKLISVRLSHAEYQQLTEACIAMGSRSVSDFARSAILDRLLKRTGTRAGLADDLVSLTRQLQDLYYDLDALSARIRQIVGDPSSETPPLNRNTAHRVDADSGQS